MTVGLSQPSETPQRRVCGTMAIHYQLLTTDLRYASARRSIENQTIAYSMRTTDIARVGITTIPVVVHVLYNTPEQNISDAQIQSQIDVLNRDFRKTNPDVESVPEPFKPLAADARIEFVLATIDPTGKPTNGITRTATTTTEFMPDDRMKSTATGGIDAWRTDRYLNLWVCRLQGGLLGYAQFPGGPPATDGVVITTTGFGTIGTARAPFNLGRTATHEIGHWLNLRHIWGDDDAGCNGSDFVDDTPNQAGPNSGKPRFPRITCNNGPNGDLYVNYMDYTDDAGMFMFTTGQVIRMQATLDRERASLGLPIPPPPPTGKPQGEMYTTDGLGAIALLKPQPGLRKTWDKIVPGNFGGDLNTDLFFYDAKAGEGEFYITNTSGTLTLLKSYPGLRKTWTHIVAGNFGRSSRTDLFFYDATAGDGEIYTTDGLGGLTLLRSYPGLRKTWSSIVSGNFGGNRFNDLFFYDPTTGEGEFYTPDGIGGLPLLKKVTGLRQTWKTIVPGSFGGNSFTDLFCYDPTSGEGQFYTSDGLGNLTPLKSYSGLRKTWTLMIPGNFGGTSNTDLLFYDATNGSIEFYTTDTRGNLMVQRQYSDFRKTWTTIVPGSFGGNNFTDLFFYDPSA
jgi:Pregnancy-associated plasma protein-A